VPSRALNTSHPQAGLKWSGDPTPRAAPGGKGDCDQMCPWYPARLASGSGANSSSRSASR